MNGCDQKFLKLFLSDFNESSCCTFDIQSCKPDRSYDLLKLYFSNSFVENFFYSHLLQFLPQSMGMKFPRHCDRISFPHHQIEIKFQQNGLGMKFPQTIRRNCIYIILRPALFGGVGLPIRVVLGMAARWFHLG